MAQVTSTGPAADAAPAPLPGHVGVLVVGAGFGGIGAAVRLGRAGHDVLVLERADDVGGTWRDNTYPGCGCDVQSHLYSFSFAPNPAWSRLYSRREEIHAYLHDVVRRFDVGRLIRTGVEVREARWDDADALWRVTTTHGDLTARVLVSATGPLSEPKLPDVAGIDAFAGPVLHSARWDHSVDLEGKDVAVVGTGASAIQIVPALARATRSLTVFQRTPAWVIPRGDRRIPAWRQRMFARFPVTQKAARALAYLSREASVVGFVRHPGVLRLAERASRAYLERHVKDPHLRAVLTPDYRLGCKRVLISDDYYRTLARPDVEVVPTGVAALDGDEVVGTDGTRRRADVVVFATGFETTDLPVAHHIVGRDGVRLSDAWAGGMEALRGSAVHGFPNLFFLIGPNTGLGHSSMVHIIESQLAYLLDALRRMDADGLDVLEPTRRAQDAWNADVQRRMARTVWATGGCASWYQDANGRITTLWPGSTVRLRRTTRRLDPSEYRVVRAGSRTPAAAGGAR